MSSCFLNWTRPRAYIVIFVGHWKDLDLPKNHRYSYTVSYHKLFKFFVFWSHDMHCQQGNGRCCKWHWTPDFILHHLTVAQRLTLVPPACQLRQMSLSFSWALLMTRADSGSWVMGQMVNISGSGHVGPGYLRRIDITSFAVVIKTMHAKVMPYWWQTGLLCLLTCWCAEWTRRLIVVVGTRRIMLPQLISIEATVSDAHKSVHIQYTVCIL